MGFKFSYVPQFYKALKSLPEKNQKQVVEKIKLLSVIEDVSVFQHIKQLAFGYKHFTHKLRVGNYRVYFRLNGNNFEAQDIIDRGKAYK